MKRCNPALRTNWTNEIFHERSTDAAARLAGFGGFRACRFAFWHSSLCRYDHYAYGSRRPSYGRQCVRRPVHCDDRHCDQCAGNMRRLVEQHRSEEHTSELQSPVHLVCRLLLEKKKKNEKNKKQKNSK